MCRLESGNSSNDTTDSNPSYGVLLDRQDSVAENPVYGSHVPTSGISDEIKNDDVKNVHYASIDDLTNTRPKINTENQYSTIDNSTTVNNPVYGGQMRYPQLNFGQFH